MQPTAQSTRLDDVITLITDSSRLEPYLTKNVLVSSTEKELMVLGEDQAEAENR